jgi:hypothetical protein
VLRFELKYLEFFDVDTRDLPFERLALDGSNYESWSIHVLNCIRIMGPLAEKIVVASILPPHLRENQN